LTLSLSTSEWNEPRIFQLNYYLGGKLPERRNAMPAKKTKLTDAERAKRIRETARDIGTDNDPASLERAFKKVIRPKDQRQDRDIEAQSRPLRDRG
jgi:hypothetical protein